MVRGDLVAFPMPRVHIDWRVLYAPPTGVFGKLLWLLCLRFGWRSMLIRLLRRVSAGHAMVDANTGRFAMEVVVVGSAPLQDALQSRLVSDRVWTAGIIGFENVGQWRQSQHTIPRLVETVVARGTDAPLDSRQFQGATHRIGVED